MFIFCQPGSFLLVENWRFHYKLLSNLRQVPYTNQSILAAERKCLVRALRLRDARDAMITSIVNLNVFPVLDHQPSGEHRVSTVILSADLAKAFLDQLATK